MDILFRVTTASTPSSPSKEVTKGGNFNVVGGMPPGKFSSSPALNPADTFQVSLMNGT